MPTPRHAPNANAHVERFNRTLREEALNHFIFFSPKHIQRVIDEYVHFYNTARPHQGIGRVPDPLRAPPRPVNDITPGPPKLIATPILGGIHHDYRRAS